MDYRSRPKTLFPFREEHVLLSVLLPLVFFVPIMVLVALWPGVDGPFLWKVFTLGLATGSLFYLWLNFQIYAARSAAWERWMEERK